MLRGVDFDWRDPPYEGHSSHHHPFGEPNHHHHHHHAPNNLSMLRQHSSFLAASGAPDRAAIRELPGRPDGERCEDEDCVSGDVSGFATPARGAATRQPSHVGEAGGMTPLGEGFDDLVSPAAEDFTVGGEGLTPQQFHLESWSAVDMPQRRVAPDDGRRLFDPPTDAQNGSGAAPMLPSSKSQDVSRDAMTVSIPAADATVLRASALSHPLVLASTGLTRCSRNQRSNTKLVIGTLPCVALGGATNERGATRKCVVRILRFPLWSNSASGMERAHAHLSSAVRDVFLCRGVDPYKALDAVGSASLQRTSVKSSEDNNALADTLRDGAVTIVDSNSYRNSSTFPPSLSLRDAQTQPDPNEENSGVAAQAAAPNTHSQGFAELSPMVSEVNPHASLTEEDTRLQTSGAASSSTTHSGTHHLGDSGQDGEAIMAMGMSTVDASLQSRAGELLDGQDVAVPPAVSLAASPTFRPPRASQSVPPMRDGAMKSLSRSEKLSVASFLAASCKGLPVLNISSESLHGGGGMVVAVASPLLAKGNIYDRFYDWVEHSNPSFTDREIVIRRIVRNVLEELRDTYHSCGKVHGNVKATNVFSSVDILEEWEEEFKRSAQQQQQGPSVGLPPSRNASSLLQQQWWRHTILVDDYYDELNEIAQQTLVGDHTASNSPSPHTASLAKRYKECFSVQEAEYVLPPECTFAISREGADSDSHRTVAFDLWNVGLLAIHLADGGFPAFLRRQSRPVPTLSKKHWSLEFYCFVRDCCSPLPQTRGTAATLLDMSPWFRSNVLPPLPSDPKERNVTRCSKKNQTDVANEDEERILLGSANSKIIKGLGGAKFNASRRTPFLDPSGRPLRHLFDSTQDGKLFVPQRHYMRPFVDVYVSCLNHIMKCSVPPVTAAAAARVPVGGATESVVPADALCEHKVAAPPNGASDCFDCLDDHEEAVPAVHTADTAAADSQFRDVFGNDDERVNSVSQMSAVCEPLSCKPPFLASFLSAVEQCRRDALFDLGYVVLHSSGDEDEVVMCMRDARLAKDSMLTPGGGRRWGTSLTQAQKDEVECVTHRYATLVQAFLNLYTAAPIIGDCWIVSLLKKMAVSPLTSGIVEGILRKTDHNASSSLAPSGAGRQENDAGSSGQARNSESLKASTGAIAAPSEGSNNSSTNNTTPTDFNNYLFCKWYTLATLTLDER